MWRGSRACRRRSTLATSSTPVGYTVAPGPSKCASPSWFPRFSKPMREPLAPCSDSGTGHSNDTGARSAFRGVAAYMDEAVVEVASALQLHGHWSRLKRRPSRWRCRPRPPSHRLAFGCSVRHSAAPRRPVAVVGGLARHPQRVRWRPGHGGLVGDVLAFGEGTEEVSCWGKRDLD